MSGKRSTGKQFEVSPLKSPPLPRRIQPIHNLDGTLQYLINYCNTPYKLRKESVSSTSTQNKSPQEDKTLPLSANALCNTTELSRSLNDITECKKCRKSEFEINTKRIAGMAFETYFECKACKISIPISKSKESKYFNGDKKRRHSMIEYESNIEPLLACNYMGCGPEEVVFLLAAFFSLVLSVFLEFNSRKTC